MPDDTVAPTAAAARLAAFLAVTVAATDGAVVPAGTAAVAVGVCAIDIGRFCKRRSFK